MSEAVAATPGMSETRAGHSVYTRPFPGNPERPALALHCMMGTGKIWAPMARTLADTIALTAFDLPGHGRSGPWHPDEGGPDLHTLTTRIAASYVSRPLDLIGHSFGATVALRLAVGAPEAVRSLTLIEPVLFAAAADPEAGQEGLTAAMAEQIARDDMIGAARSFLNVWGGPPPFDELPPILQQGFAAQVPLVISTNEVLLDDRADILRAGGLESIDAPVLLIAGENSPRVAHDIIDALAARLPDVGRAIIPGAGHMAPVTHPDQVTGLIGVNLERA